MHNAERLPSRLYVSVELERLFCLHPGANSHGVSSAGSLDKETSVGHASKFGPVVRTYIDLDHILRR